MLTGKCGIGSVPYRIGESGEVNRPFCSFEPRLVGPVQPGRDRDFLSFLPSAALLIAEADAVKEATGSRIASYAALALAGIRGRAAEASELIDGIVRETTAVGQGFGVQCARWANSVLMNGLGRYEEALAAAMQASDHTPELFIETWALIELIEAPTRTENRELGKRALARLGEQTRGERRRLGARNLRPVARAAKRRSSCRAIVPRSRRPPGPHASPSGTRSRAFAVRRMAATRRATRRCARTAAFGPRSSCHDRHGSDR